MPQRARVTLPVNRLALQPSRRQEVALEGRKKVTSIRWARTQFRDSVGVIMTTVMTIIKMTMVMRTTMEKSPRMVRSSDGMSRGSSSA